MSFKGTSEDRELGKCVDGERTGTKDSNIEGTVGTIRLEPEKSNHSDIKLNYRYRDLIPSFYLACFSTLLIPRVGHIKGRKSLVSGRDW